MAPKLSVFSGGDDAAKPSLPTPPLAGNAQFHDGDGTVHTVFAWYTANNPNPSKCKKSSKERARLYALFLKGFGSRTCSECRPHDLLAFINQFAGENNWTRKRWNSTLQRPFNVAVQLGLIIRNPFRGLTFPEGENGRDWTYGEYRALLRTAKPHLRRFIIFIRFSGMRPGEIRDLQWRNVRLDGNMIVLEEHKMVGKTKAPRRIPLNHVLVKLLVWLRRNTATNAKRLFLNSFGRPWTLSMIVQAIQDIRIRAGLSDEVKLHGGRHTFATRAIMNGVDVGTLAQILGHARIEMTQRYMHLAGKTTHLNEAMERAIDDQIKKSAPNNLPKGETV